MKINKKWLTATIICLILAIGSMTGFFYFNGKTEGIEDAGISTGNKNRCLLYDEENQILFVGTHDNQLIAWKDQEEIWRVSANGPFSELVLDKEDSIIYAGNEDGNIYIYQEMDGSLKQTINVQRRIVSIDVSNDKTKIVAATSTGSSKANILVYDAADGTELANNKYTVRLSGVKYCEDNASVLTVNNRGEITRMSENGEIIESYGTNYSILQLIRQGDMYWVICKDGSYYGFGEDLEIQRQGKVDNTLNAVMSSIGVDSTNSHVIVGTDEGYFFIMNGEDKQIYSSKIDVKLTDFGSAGDNIYMTGLGDAIYLVHVDNLAHINANLKIVKVLKICSVIFLLLCIVFFIMTVEKVRKRVHRMIKKIWRCRMAYIMLLPTLLLIYFFNYRGIGTAFIRAFTNWSKINTSLAQISFVGLENFKRMFVEGYFLIGIKNLVLLMVTGIIKVLTVPLLVAWLVYSISGSKRKYIHRFLFVLPIVVPGVISAMTWQKIYDPSIGLLNEILGAMHLENLQRVWLGDAKTAIWAVIFMGFPFVGAMAFLVYYGGFLNIGRDVEESAMIDGASRWDIFWKIQLPLIRPQISIMITLQIIGTMQDFNGIFILTGGGPGTATYVPALELYLNVAQFGRYGYACALGVILFIFTMTVTLLSNRLTREKE